MDQAPGPPLRKKKDWKGLLDRQSRAFILKNTRDWIYTGVEFVSPESDGRRKALGFADLGLAQTFAEHLRATYGYDTLPRRASYREERDRTTPPIKPTTDRSMLPPYTGRGQKKPKSGNPFGRGKPIVTEPDDYSPNPEFSASEVLLRIDGMLVARPPIEERYASPRYRQNTKRGWQGKRKQMVLGKDGVVRWRCVACEQLLEVERFAPDPKSSNGIRGICRRCVAAESRVVVKARSNRGSI